MARRDEDRVQTRGHHFAIVDEVDSVLIDDARTPLIISGPTSKGDQHEFNELKGFVESLMTAQEFGSKGIDAKRMIADGETDEGGVKLLRATVGYPSQNR